MIQSVPVGILVTLSPNTMAILWVASQRVVTFSYPPTFSPQVDVQRRIAHEVLNSFLAPTIDTVSQSIRACHQDH